MSLSITDWYGRNTIGWGESYEVSHAGNVNEANFWGLFKFIPPKNSRLVISKS